MIYMGKREEETVAERLLDKITELRENEERQERAAEEMAEAKSPAPQEQAVSFHRPYLFGLSQEEEQLPEQGLFYRADGQPFLRFWMKNCFTAELYIGEEKYAFFEVERNIWELTLQVAPGFYYVTLLIDGVEVMSPYLPVGYGYARPCNYLEIGPSKEYLQELDCPHGDIRHEYFYAQTTGRTETCLVYTPPGYQKDSECYPVLYLQHGFGENETSWVWQGRIRTIADRLLFEKKMKPMLIVMADGMVREEKEGKTHLTHPKFTALLIRDILPVIEKKYRVKADRNNRAMAGLSMGSMQTAMTVFTHPELFAWAGLFSGFMRDYIGREEPGESHLERLCQEPSWYNENLFLLFRAMGKQDVFFQRFLQEDQLCEDHGIRCVRRIYEGGHDWNVWRECIYEFLQMLFK